MKPLENHKTGPSGILGSRQKCPHESPFDGGLKGLAWSPVVSVASEVRPVEMAGAMSNTASSTYLRELQPNSVDLQPAGGIDMITDSSARQQLDPRACRSSDQRAGRQQVAPALRNETTCELEPGGASGLNDVAGTDSDQVQSSENLNEASEVELGLGG